MPPLSFSEEKRTCAAVRHSPEQWRQEATMGICSVVLLLGDGENGDGRKGARALATQVGAELA